MRETSRHRNAFEAYWKLGAARSIEALHVTLTASGRCPSLRTLYEWSRQLHWQNRILGLDQEARRAEDDARVQALREMYDRHAKEALLLQQRGAEWLTTLGEERVTVDGAIRAIVEGVRMERLARGEATERTETKGDLTIDGRLARISDEELDRLIDYANSSVGREGTAESA